MRAEAGCWRGCPARVVTCGRSLCGLFTLYTMYPYFCCSALAAPLEFCHFFVARGVGGEDFRKHARISGSPQTCVALCAQTLFLFDRPAPGGRAGGKAARFRPQRAAGAFGAWRNNSQQRHTSDSRIWGFGSGPWGSSPPGALRRAGRSNKSTLRSKSYMSGPGFPYCVQCLSAEPRASRQRQDSKGPRGIATSCKFLASDHLVVLFKVSEALMWGGVGWHIRPSSTCMPRQIHREGHQPP